MNRGLTKKIFLVIVSLVIGFVICYYWLNQNIVLEKNPNCLGDSTLINPEPDCEFFNKKVVIMTSLQKNVEDDVSEYIKNDQATRIGVFARDLLSQRFIGVNDGDIFFMASLLKLPILIGGYKLAEVEPQILDVQIKYTDTINSYDEQTIKPIEKLENGKSYSVKELMQRAVIYSDNSAAKLLFDFYPKSFVDRILSALGLQLRNDGDVYENPVTPRAYANIFRILYNSSYLTRQYSNDSLDILAKSTYKEGALGKLPSNILVAHKFGERTISRGGKVLRQLHDCGIVYLKNGDEPYTFCIMTEGTDFEKLKIIIQNISLDIFNHMNDSGSNTQ